MRQFPVYDYEETELLDYSVLHLGDHNVTAGIQPCENASDVDKKKLAEAFTQADTAEAIRLLDQMYGKDTFSLRTLFRDEQRKIANIILTDSLNSAAAVYKTVFEGQAPLIRFLTGLDIPVPNALKAAAEMALNSQLQHYLERPELDKDGIQGLLREAAASKITLDGQPRIHRPAASREGGRRVCRQSNRHCRRREIVKVLDLLPFVPFPVVLWEAQNLVYRPLLSAFQQNGWHAPNADPLAARR